ncbi:Peroxidase [Quillaja saponaria]|uniref:Peroxidase n=1 Tax=Quillaja saponaria TaxID=32244 RepID=A0AAD7KYE5_QUISA|nr:Peroxidase [Quillaja saponaria]
MAISRLVSRFSQLILMFWVIGLTNANLKLGFYQETCPGAEDIVAKTTFQIVSRSPTLAASLSRLHNHDCFVRGTLLRIKFLCFLLQISAQYHAFIPLWKLDRIEYTFNDERKKGCDGSVLLDSTKTNKAEKESLANLSLRGFHVIDTVKAAVEKKCPGVVSCADILALVARDAVATIHGPYWEVPTGRRDGRVSISSEVIPNVPAPFFDINKLKSLFSAKGLSVKDLVVLSGAHTIGVSHCSSFSSRLFNFTGKGDTDPTLDPTYLLQLKQKCKPGDANTLVEMDSGSFKNFDEDYYNLVSKRRGLFQSDASLLDDTQTKAYVNFQANSHGYSFSKDFAASVVKMGKIEVLTGNEGEIRKHCSFIN